MQSSETTQASSVLHSSDWRAEMGFLDKIRSFVESGELDKITEKVGQTVNTLLDEQKKTQLSMHVPLLRQ